MSKKTIGILGGMGPEVTAELFLRIIKATPAEKDQDYLRIIVDSNPKIPDRTEAILGRGVSPLSELVATALNLEKAKADFIIMPCNTAHYYYENLAKKVKIPILNMVELAAQEISSKLSKMAAKKAGLIATTGTVASKIYEKELDNFDIQVLIPSKDLQNAVMIAIYENIKSGNLPRGRKKILKIAQSLITDGAKVIICGCTEVSLVLKDGDLSVPVIDPLQILAEAAVATALGRAN